MVQSNAPQPDDIVVRAVRHKCRIEIANRILSDPEFNARAKEWARGVPVRVMPPDNASTAVSALRARKISAHIFAPRSRHVPNASALRLPEAAENFHEHKVSFRVRLSLNQ
jgi:hypothetical protein